AYLLESKLSTSDCYTVDVDLHQVSTGSNCPAQIVNVLATVDPEGGAVVGRNDVFALVDWPRRSSGRPRDRDRRRRQLASDSVTQAKRELHWDNATICIEHA